MIDVDERIRAEVDRLVPAPSGFAADWGDVLTRSGPSRPSRAGRRRLLVLAATVAAVLAVIAATPLGAALARTLDDFSAWITGDAGSPASPAEQRAFQEANGRSWAASPPGQSCAGCSRRPSATRSSRSTGSAAATRSASA